MEIKKDNSQPLLSIVLLAYNNLDYTKLCIESLFKYVSHLSFELITINNGSTDDTKKYFETLPHSKKIDLENNQVLNEGFNAGFKLAKGKYILALRNNIIFTQHAIDNLLKCLESDEKIGMVVPACNYSSNFQQIEYDYSNLDKMHDFAKRYNTSNYKRWEERIRLITYTWLMKRDLLEKLEWLNDDDLSFRVRRYGYKLILAKDTFVHQFRFVDNTHDYEKGNYMNTNQKEFIKNSEIDILKDCYIDSALIESISYKNMDNVNILGIDPLCGGNLLQIKNRFKEKGSKKVNLYAVSQDDKYIEDLRTVCDCIIWDEIKEIKTYFKENMFDYVIIGKSLEEYKNIELIFNDLKNIVKKDGRIIFTIKNLSHYINIINLLQDSFKSTNNNYLFSYFNKYELLNKLHSIGYTLAHVVERRTPIPNCHEPFVQNMQMCFLNLNVKKAQALLTTDSYIFSIKKLI